MCFSGGSIFKQMKSVARGRFRGGTDNSSICLDCLHAEYFLHFFGRLYNTGDYLLIFFHLKIV